MDGAPQPKDREQLATEQPARDLSANSTNSWQTSVTPEATHLSYVSVAAFDAIIDSIADTVHKDLQGSAWTEHRKRSRQLKSLRCLKAYKDFPVTANDRASDDPRRNQTEGGEFRRHLHSSLSPHRESCY